MICPTMIHDPISLLVVSNSVSRFKLLSQMENFVEHLSNKIVNDQVCIFSITVMVIFIAPIH